MTRGQLLAALLALDVAMVAWAAWYGFRSPPMAAWAWWLSAIVAGWVVPGVGVFALSRWWR